MNRKYTLETVREIFKKEGCELLAEEYNNCDIPMKYRCICGNESKISLYHFREGKRCMSCGIKKRSSKKKHSQKEVEYIFKKEGCKLLDKYKNNNSPVKYRCVCGNISSTVLGRFKEGSRCKKCGIKRRANSHRYSQEEVNSYFKERDCVLLDKYITCEIPLKYKCNCGNTSKITFSNFKRGQRCIYCKIDKLSGENSSNWNPDRSKIRSIKRIHSLSSSYKRKFRKKYNINNLKIHIDHIFPIKAFVENNIYDLDIINGESNLQFLTEMDNKKKSGKYKQEEFLKYINSLKLEGVM